MSNFITKIFIAEFLSNFKVSEFEHELELGDLDRNYANKDSLRWINKISIFDPS